MAYDREAAVAYAHAWAMDRNPEYEDFSGMGGDCTNFISQCLHAGGAPMNYTRTFGWYFISLNDRTPAWTGVEQLYDFLIGNQAEGPFAREIEMGVIMPGDVIQLSFVPGIFSHSLLVVSAGARPDPSNILIATHTDDSDNRRLDTYWTVGRRFLSVDARD